MKKIRIAQIGTAHDHASVIFQTLRYLDDVFEVVGYAEVPEDNNGDPWQTKNLQGQTHIYEGVKKYSVDEILNIPDLDAVSVETFDLNLVKYAQKAADKGLHIHMDKAPGESVEEFEKLLSTVKEKGLAFNIGYMYRQNPLIEQAFERVKKGELGKIHSVETEMSCFYEKDKRDWLGMLKGGMMQYLGCHLVDLVVRLLGVPEKIIPFNQSTGFQGTNGKDFGFAVFQYPNGYSTVKSVMGDHGGYVRRHMVINGEKGTIEIRPLEKFEQGVLHGISTASVFYDKTEWHDLGERTDSGAFCRYEKPLRDFGAQVREGKGYTVDLQTEARVHRCLLSACGIKCDYKGKIKI